MGNCSTHTDNFDSTIGLTRSHFLFIYAIGKGGFGKVWKVQHKSSKQFYAMKEMLKNRVIAKKSVASVMNERRLLTTLKHSFIVNMHFAFQDRENLYLGMDLLPGGDLRYHIARTKVFTEEQVQFFVAAILTALEYVHSCNIIHRDLKPENLVMDAQGYIRLTDFGIARLLRPENSQDTSGTPGYMAPEVICRQNHGLVSDFFALGVIIHELMLGRRPYVGRNRKDIRDAILAKQVQIRAQDIPEGWSIEAADFCSRLLQRKPANRLGLNGILEVKTHPWLHNIDWTSIENKTFPSPFPLVSSENFDSRVAGQEWRDDEQALLAAAKQSTRGLFEGYFYDEKLNGEAGGECSK
jgi:serine/threonine protein kinase